MGTRKMSGQKILLFNQQCFKFETKTMTCPQVRFQGKMTWCFISNAFNWKQTPRQGYTQNIRALGNFQFGRFP